MSNNDTEIANDFVQRKPIRKDLLSIVGARGGYYKHGLYPEPGAARFSYDEHGVLWSYEVMQLARWLADGTLLVNGDEGPSNMTKEQQRTMRAAIKRHPPAKVALVPFSALRAARVDPRDVEIVDVTPDREIEQLVPCQSTKCADAGTSHKHPRKVHFLGETLFRVKHQEWSDKANARVARHDYFVSGLDRNDDPARRNFFLAQLPAARPAPKTVDDALALLRPKGVPEDALRQGEWFLVPAPDKKFKSDLKKIIKDTVARSNTEDLKAGVPIVSDDSKEQVERIKNGGWSMHARRERHRATRMVCNDAVYVSGMLRDAEHGALKLSDGKTWHKVVKNRAVGSWRAGGDVD